MPEYIIKSNSIHEKFLKSRAKVQVFGGGFANGKTACACIKSIQFAKDYPGSNGLIARSTYPKLADTIQKEFFKWLPQAWIRRFTKMPNPTLELINGSVINFRHVQQGGKHSGTNTTSNLLSSTYDWIGIDQIDDPEFVHKDFTDVLGRLRGTTAYVGDDPTMPQTGPRQLLVTLNPTRNWFYKEYVAPVLTYMESGNVPPKLQKMIDEYNKAAVAVGASPLDRPESLIELVQGSTYENMHNLGADYVATMRSTYSGMLADRYIEGQWGAFQGLVYPMFQSELHMRPASEIDRWKHSSRTVRFIEAFDYGQRAPQCYILFLMDDDSNVVGVDGFKERECTPEEAVDRIKSIRQQWSIPPNTTQAIYADPNVFARRGGEYRTVGKSIADVYTNSGRGVTFTRGNNDIASGILKVGSYLTPHKFHINPFTGNKPGPFLYFNMDKLWFVDDEITDYFYEESDDPTSDVEKPMDRNDHAMDTIKYGLTSVPDLKRLIPRTIITTKFLTSWTERPDGIDDGEAAARYA